LPLNQTSIYRHLQQKLSTLQDSTPAFIKITEPTPKRSAYLTAETNNKTNQK